MKIPTEPIQEAYIYFAGELAAGIPDSSFIMQIFIDPNCFAPDEISKIIEDAREIIKTAYTSLQGEQPAYVRFDFEVKES
jgi:hypothetical protein